MTTALLPEQDDADELRDDAADAEAQQVGVLLRVPPKRAAKMAARLWTALDGPMAELTPYWERNRLVRKGYRGIRVVGTATATDDSDGIWMPPGTMDAPPVPNNVDQLVRRVVDTLTADEPKIEAVAPSTDDQDIEAAELATSILALEDNAQAANLRKVVQKALGRAGTYGSAFSFQYVDPYGVREPLELLAHPGATDPENPLVDPATGMPGDEGTYVTRYVTAGEDGTRTLSPSLADCEYVWKPVVREEILNPHCVRMLPATATTIDDADMVFVGRVTTLGALKGLYPETVGQMEPAELKKLCAWRPAVGKKYWTPVRLAEAMQKAAEALEERDPNGGDIPPADEQPVFIRCLYGRATRDYPRGLFLCLGADHQLLGRGEWVATVGDGEQAREETYELPVAQCTFFDDPNDQNPYGISPVEWLAPMDEAVATQILAWLEYLYRFNHPNTYLPLGSPIQPGMLNIRDGTPIRYEPATGKPEYEQIPNFPGEGPALIEKFEAWMHTLAGLENAARGLADPSVKSGIHAERIIEQALLALTQPASNVQDFLLRRGRVRLQLIATSYTAPRLLRYDSAGGLAQVRAFQGADLRTVRQVRLQRNSMTMLTRSAKVAMLREELDIATKSGDPSAYLRYRQGAATLVDRISSGDSDPHEQRVQRQLAVWEKGPQPNTDPATLWAPVPVDTDPMVAPLRAYRLGRAIASDRYAKFDATWNAGLDQAYQAARQAAGLLNAAEQQQRQAQAPQQQAPQAELAKQQAEQAKQQAEAAKAQQAHQQDLEKITVKAEADTQSKLAVAEMQAATRAQFPLLTTPTPDGTL